MSRDDNKQVEDALQAIKKLVEISESKLSSDEEVINLDNVVWRNPVSEAEDTSVQTEAAPTPSSLSVSSYDLNKLKSQIKERTPSNRDSSIQKPVEAQVKISPQPIENDEKNIITSPVVTPPLELSSPESTPDTSRQKLLNDMAEIAGDIQELTGPIGRRGGGFYSDRPAVPAPKPIIVTSPLEKTASDSVEPAEKPSQPRTADVKQEMPGEKVASEIEPAITDFQGADFNFSTAEGLMTAADFEEMAQLSTPVKPNIQVPIADPPVANPVDEVQMMFQPAEEEVSHATGQPNLHVVSDQTFEEENDEENGFSGDVRMALRSLIREQVSTWLQGNMTGLIEEALSSPNKKPSSKSRPKTTKR